MANNDRRLRISHRVVVGTVVGLVLGFSIAAGLASQGRVVAQVDTLFEGGPQTKSPGRQQERVRGRIPGGVPGGVRDGVPGGVSGGVSGGVPGGVSGGIPGGVPDGIPGGVPGGIPGGVAGGIPGGVASGIPDGMPGGIPGGVAGGIPGGVPGGIPGGVPGGLPGGNQGGVRGGIPGGVSGGVAPDGIPGGVPGGVDGELFVRLPGGSVVTTQDAKDLIQELNGAPDMTIEFKNRSGSPVTISASSSRWVRLEKRDGTPTQTSNVYLMRPTLKLLNNSERVVTGLVVEFRDANGRSKVYVERISAHLASRDSLTLHHRLFSFEGDPISVVVQVVGVLFKDGTTWGNIPR